MFKNICLIGAGNIGSRHLQGLALVPQALSIQVIDPSAMSLATAKQRYQEVDNGLIKHHVVFLYDLNQVVGPIDIAIVATNSDIRSTVAKKLLNQTRVKNIIFEKILFNKHTQYEEIQKLLDSKQCKAWVDCSMRTDPFYSGLKKQFDGQPITYIVHGSLHGLMSNAIHYIDHIAYLSNCYDFTVDTSHLNPKPVSSKRKGFLELFGILNVFFTDGSLGSFICYPKGNTPFTIEILSEKTRCLMRVMENKSYLTTAYSGWKWKIKKTAFLYQSQMTNKIVTSILKSGSFNLPSFAISSKMHLNFLEPILEFLNSYSKKKFDVYPFT